MNGAHADLKVRTKQFALQIIHLTRALPNKPEAWVISKQILKSGTSVAANYRSAGRARSRAEFAAKMGVALEEADETAFWLELLSDTGVVRKQELEPLMREADEIVSILVACCKRARENPR
jgi:four helix bundle protein